MVLQDHVHVHIRVHVHVHIRVHVHVHVHICIHIRIVNTTNRLMSSVLTGDIVELQWSPSNPDTVGTQHLWSDY